MAREKQLRVVGDRRKILSKMLPGEVWYTDLQPKNVMSYCTNYKIHNIRTERCMLIHYSSRSGGEEKWVEDITVVYKD